jgi:two-component system response regulator AtoC
MSSILIVDDEEGMRKSLSILFQKEGYNVCPVSNGQEALLRFGREVFDLVITDLRMDGMNGIQLLNRMKEKHIDIPVIIMTAYGTIDSAVEAMRIGASDYVAKPFEYDEILHRAKRAIEQGTTARDIEKMQQDQVASDQGLSIIVGRSQVLTNIKKQLKKISMTTFPVLITGETGTGKTLLAKAIHLNSPQADGPFISVNCASIPEQLLESELFGHTKGAFTGAIMERKGLFEAAHQGTILLDEIGSVPKALQVKLLGVLQDRVIRKVGSNEETLIDTRVIVATNVDLPAAIKKGDFREDLYYRINVLSVHLPPLREHKEDIPVLAEHFLTECTRDQKKASITGFAPECMSKLYRYDYPGNIRELQNIVCRAVAISEPPLVLCDDLCDLSWNQPGLQPQEMDEATHMDIKEWEKKIIQQTIARHPNNLAEACKELKIGRTTLWRKMKQYKIEMSG